MRLPDLIDGLEFEAKLKRSDEQITRTGRQPGKIANPTGDIMAMVMYGLIEETEEHMRKNDELVFNQLTEQEPVSPVEDKIISLALSKQEYLYRNGIKADLDWCVGCIEEERVNERRGLRLVGGR